MQVKTRDNCKELRNWVENSFGKVQNRVKEVQDFTKVDGNGDKSGEAAGLMPFQDNLDEMLVVNSQTSKNQITLVFCFENTIDPRQDAHLDMIIRLLNHQGEGTMFDVLKSLNYIQSMDIDPSRCMRTAMRFLTMEFVLTHTGIESYEKVLAIIFEYLRKVREEWMPNGEEI